MSHHIHGPDTKHGAVHIVSKKHPVHVVIFFLLIIRKSLLCLLSFRYSPAATRNPEVPQAGSQIISSADGSISLNHHPDNMSWCTELTVSARTELFLESRYSYTSPRVSTIVLSSSVFDFIHQFRRFHPDESTTLDSTSGVGSLKIASSIYLEYALSLSPCRVFINGNTHSCIIEYILSAGKS